MSGKGVLSLTNVRNALLNATTIVEQSVADAFAEECSLYEAECESPIEMIFVVWWRAVRKVAEAADGQYCADLELWPQQVETVGDRNYRLDFMVAVGDPDLLWEAHRLGVGLNWKIAVELDGHEFHERTKEQVAKRNTRDRDLQRAGWKVFHFSGSEVVRDGRKCAEEVFRYSQNEYRSIRQAVRNARLRNAIPDSVI